jgi:hypothetical protein
MVRSECMVSVCQCMDSVLGVYGEEVCQESYGNGMDTILQRCCYVSAVTTKQEFFQK